jgi:hypothetical protein
MDWTRHYSIKRSEALTAGRARELKPGAIVLGLLCLVYFVLGLPH